MAERAEHEQKPGGDHHHHHHEKLHVTWDEATIAEHDLLRGTRQKIEEPNTPYHYYEAAADGAEPVSPARSLSGHEGGAPTLEWDELESKLRGVEQHGAAQRASEWDGSDDDDGGSGAHFAPRDTEGKKLEKDPAFAVKRKKHYNEFERVKAWRQAHAADEEEDEDAAGDDDDEHEEKKSKTDA